LLAGRLGLTHYELDALHHGPGWTKRPTFEADVEAFVATAQWVTEDQYHRFIGDRLWQQADTVVWLDLPRSVVMGRLLRRSARRAISRTELWNGNREDWRHWLDVDHPLRWTWENFARRRADTLERAEQYPEVNLARLTTAREVDRWLTNLPTRRDS
jgi:adenylate kinase family enzyme